MAKVTKDKVATESYVWKIFNIFEEKMDKKFEQVEKKAEKRFDKMMTQLIDIAGQFKKFGEEQTILSAHSKDHTDRIEKLEKAVFNTPHV